MADNGMDLDEVRDLLRFLEDKNDYMADPFSRAGMGSGMFNQESFAPEREYVPTPYTDMLRGWSAQTQDGGQPTTLDGFIADEIMYGGSATSALIKLQSLHSENPEALTGILPMAQSDDNFGIVGDQPDWGLVQKTAEGMFNNYQKELGTLANASQGEDGRYYTETPSKAAQRFTDLGLPLPTDEYNAGSVGLSEMQPSFRDYFGQGGTDQMFGDEVNRARESYDNSPGYATNDFAGNPIDQQAMMGLSLEGMTPSQRSHQGLGTEAAADEPVDLRQQAIMDRYAKGGLLDAMQKAGIDPVGVHPNSSFEPDVPLTDAQVANLDIGGHVTGKNKKALDDAKAMRQRARDAFTGQFDKDYFQQMGRLMAHRDTGATPLSDTLGDTGAQYGLSAGFAPQMEAVARDVRPGSGQSYLRADKNNPNYYKNKWEAFQALTGRNTAYGN